MSLKIVCDICESSENLWEFKRTWKITQWRCTGFENVLDEMDICDKCIREFIIYVKERKEKCLTK